MIGRTLSHYQILEKLGEGGMGVVYKARDTHLDRFVALKVLPPERVADPERKRRFVQEAKAASALNHPNIITIHDIDEADDIHFIAMEYVAGKTLDQLIPRKGMRLNDALKAVVQIADALTAAHEAGIVHRDLKPGNVMLTEKGQVKVLDFGLAKLVEPVMGEEAPTQTAQGTIVGTVTYMSPEQAQGKPVDARSDIFSFGSLLYEMVTGQRAFRGDSNLSTLAAILNKEPEPLSAEVPHDLEKLITRCLRKDSERRFQLMKDLKVELEELKEESDSGRLVARPPGSALPARRWRYSAAGAAVAVAVTATVLVVWLPRSAKRNMQHKLTRLTSDSGLTFQPALSADGKLLAYASDRSSEGNLDIWVQQLGGGEPLRLTRDEADDDEPHFSPDGARIAFHSGRDGGGVYVIPTLGGQPRRLAAEGRTPRFSPDGRRIAYWVRGGTGDPRGWGNKLFVVSSTDGSALPQPKGPPPLGPPTWSPDGRYLLFQAADPPVPFTSSGEHLDWWLAPVDGGPATKTGALHFLRQRGIQGGDPAAWTGHGVYFSGTSGHSTNLWRIRLSPGVGQPDGPPDRLTFGTAQEWQPTGTAAGRAAFSSTTVNTDIWNLSIDGSRLRVAGQPHQVTREAGQDREPSVSADGTRLAFVSDRTGNAQVWMKELAAGREVSLATGSGQLWNPRLTSDGTRVLYSDIRGEKLATYVVPSDASAMAQLCGGSALGWDWHPDGRHYLAATLTFTTVWMRDTQSATEMEVIRHPAFRLYQAHFSPDGRWIQFIAEVGERRSRIYIVPFRPGSVATEKDWIPVTDGTAWDDYLAWSQDGNSIYFVSNREGWWCLWTQRLDPNTKRPLGSPAGLYHFHGARFILKRAGSDPLQISASRDKIFFNLSQVTGNIWMLEPGEP